MGGISFELLSFHMVPLEIVTFSKSPEMDLIGLESACCDNTFYTCGNMKLNVNAPEDTCKYMNRDKYI